jgi:hypothetical protein
VGNVGLLSPMQKLVSLRVSREVSSPDAIYRVVKRMENAVEKGYACKELRVSLCIGLEYPQFLTP